jgi:fatty acid desaturase
MTATNVRPDMTSPESTAMQSEEQAAEWRQAKKRLESRQKLRLDILAYVIINAGLVLTWLMTGRGYFWPGWVMGAWGAFLLLDVFTTYLRKPITHADVEAELRRHR